MHLTLHNRSLLRGWFAGAVLLAGVSACSRPDRAETGSSQDQTGTATTDTAAVADTQSSVGPTQADTQAGVRDTAVSSGDTRAPQPLAQSTTRRKAQPSAAAPTTDTSVSGYQAMTGDTATSSTETASTTDTLSTTDTASAEMAGATDTASAEMAGATPTDRVRPPEDSAETMGVVTTSDSVAAIGDTTTGSAEMARDTSTSLAQADTAAQVQVDTTTQMSDTATTQVAADTGASIQARVDTSSTDQQTEVAAQAQSDTAVVVGDSTEMGKTGERLEPSVATAQANADTLAAETERIRPPEDSTEVYGNVTGDQDQPKDGDRNAAPDQAPVAGAGVQTSGKMVTGAEAVAQVTREGQRCMVVDTEDSEEDIRWDLAGSPATMNPCGTGTMTLPRIQTEK